MLPGTLILKTPKFWKWLVLAVLAAVISQLLYSVLRLSPLFGMIEQKDAVFVYSFKEWLTHPFNFLYGNIHGLFDWAIHYLTWPIFLSAILAGLAVWKFPREKLLLLGWWFAPFFALALDGRVLYPRFILFMILPLVILSGVAVVWIWNHFRGSVWRWVLLTILFFGSFYTDYYIIANPLYAPIPSADAGQYINDWPSGWGIPKVNAFLLKESQKGKISVYTDGTFGLLPYAIELYLVDNPNITIKGMYPIPGDIPQELIDQAGGQPTYMIFNQKQDIPPWPMKFIAQYQKGQNTVKFMRLYEVLPKASGI